LELPSSPWQAPHTRNLSWSGSAKPIPPVTAGKMVAAIANLKIRDRRRCVETCIELSGYLALPAP
jgi:hypothetical protein